MSWKVRHEGSPQAVENLTPEQVLQGMLDGQWEPTDEVRGPEDTTWVPLESHPQFAEAASEIEPPPPRIYDDETRLDMTALIDVCLVLLIFFILTTTYATLQKLIEAAEVSTDKATGVPVKTTQEVKETMVRVTVRINQDKDEVTVKVEGNPPLRVPRDLFSDNSRKEERVAFERELTEMLLQFTGAARKTKVLLDHSDRVPHAFIVALQDAAKNAHMERVLLLLP